MEYLNTRQVLEVIHNINPALPVGSLCVTTPDETQKATFYFKDNLVYALDIEGYQFPLDKRLISSGLASKDDVDFALSSLGKDKKYSELVSHIISLQIVSTREVTSLVVEDFLAKVSDVLSWDKVTATWKHDDVTQDFTVNFIDIPTLMSICATRRARMKKILNSLRAVENFFSTKYRVVADVNEQSPSDLQLLSLHHSSSIDGATAMLGMNRLSFMKILSPHVEQKNIVIETLPEPEETAEEKALSIEKDVQSFIRQNAPHIDSSISPQMQTILNNAVMRILVLEDEILIDEESLREIKADVEQTQFIVLDDEKEVLAKIALFDTSQEALEDKKLLLQGSRQRFDEINALLRKK